MFGISVSKTLSSRLAWGSGRDWQMQKQQHRSALLIESHADLLARPDALKTLRSCRLQSLAVGFVLEPVLHAPNTASQSEVDVIASSCIMTDRQGLTCCSMDVTGKELAAVCCLMHSYMTLA